MRCAMRQLVGVVLAIGIVGCGGGDDSGGNRRADRSSSAHDAAPNDALPDHRAAADDGDFSDDASDPASTPARETPTVARQDVERIKPEATAKPKPATKRQTDHWAPETQFRPGTLTAGSIDDHARYSVYRDYLSSTMQQFPDRQFHVMNFGRRILIRVTNPQGHGIGDARVTVHRIPSNNQEADDVVGEFNTTTSSDGRALFLSARDLSFVGCDYQLTVQPAGGGQPVTRRVTLDQPLWNVVLAEEKQRLPAKLDLALVIDTTGSM